VEKIERESCWKSGGGQTRLYTWPRVGLANEAGADTIPEAAGGERGHRVTKPEGVIHRYIFNHMQRTSPLANGAHLPSQAKTSTVKGHLMLSNRINHNLEHWNSPLVYRLQNEVPPSW
jgi:hypothetical protein